MDISRICKITGQQFQVTDREQQLLDKMEIPLPTLCIDERLRRRLAHRNERTLYKNKCGLTGKSIVSLYSPDSPYKVYSQEAWWGDSWDAREYGRDFDFNRPFFDQFRELQIAVPRIALLNIKAENSEYCNITTSNKNCYLVFGGDFNEDCMYCTFNFHSLNTNDCYWVDKCELCYECVDCFNCYNLKFSQNSWNCRDSAFLYECRNCENCIDCAGLRSKKYHIFNIPYSAEAYAQKLREMKLDTHGGLNEARKTFEEFKIKLPHKHAYQINCENSTGDRLTNCKNVFNCFDAIGSEDIKDIFIAVNIKDSFSCDHVGHGGAQLYYKMLGSIEGYNCAFCSFSWNGQNTYYCDSVVANCRDLFGCTNMKRSENCILNKQYTKEKYTQLRAKIVEHMKKTGEWGEYFPITHSPFAYNETIANEYFPLSKEEALKKGYKWREKDIRDYQPQNYKIPDSLKEI